MKSRFGKIQHSFDVSIRGAKNLFHLRMVELFAFFAIVFVAREIADFNYRSDLFLGLFLGAAFLQFNGHNLWRLLGSMAPPAAFLSHPADLPTSGHSRCGSVVNKPD